MDHNVYSNVQTQQLHLQNQGRGYTAEEYITEEEDDDSGIRDPHYEYFLENLRPHGKSYVLDIIEDNVFVKYHDESSTPETVSDLEAENANHVSNAPVNYVGKRRGRNTKGPKLHADKSDNGSGNHVASEAQKHESNHYGKRRGRKPKGEKLSGDKNPNGSTSSKHVASEPQKHMHNHEGKRRGRKPKEAPKLHDTKNPNGINNHVASEAHKHAGRHRVKRARKNVVPSPLNPDYEYFVENLRPNGKSYVLDIIEGNLLIKYHDESSTPEAVSDLEAENANHVSNAPVNYVGKCRGRKPKHPKLHADKSGNGSGNHVASETQKHESNHYGKRRGRKPKVQKLSADKNPNGSTSSKHVASEPQKLVHNQKGKRRGRKPKEGPKLHATTKNPNGNNNHVASEAHKHAGRHMVKKARKNVVPSSVETACFSQTEGQNSLDHGKKVNHTDTPPCITSRVKEENEDYDDDDAPPSIKRPVQDPVLNVEHFWDNDEANAKKLTKYREKLMEELKMPYCEEEYERLLEDITSRKPVQGMKDLRGRTKIFEEDYDGKSLLDHHIDLKKKIDSARDDHPKVLNLLRGFFYWLMRPKQYSSSWGTTALAHNEWMLVDGMQYVCQLAAIMKRL